MTTTNDTSEQGKTLPPAQTLEGAKRAAAILMHDTAPMIAEEDRTDAYVDFGAGLAFAVSSAGSFTLVGLERGGHSVLTLTPTETRALFRFWLPICSQVVMQHLTEAVAHIKAKKAEEAAPTPTVSTPSVDLQDASNWAGNIIHTAIMMHADDLLPAELRQVWGIAGSLLGDRYSKSTHVAYLRMLDALIASPDATQEVLKRARTHLYQTDPRVSAYRARGSEPAALPGAPPVSPELAVPRSLEISGSDVDLLPTGEITIGARANGAPVVRFTLKESYALLTFLRLPGVATLIEQADAASQLQGWRSFEADPETQAERAAAGT